MSKNTLKKELELLSAEQLRQIILDAYNVNSDFKQYFEFFLNPDIDKFRNNKIELIKKELSRSKWGVSKARTSVINKIVKEFIAYNVGTEHTIDFINIVLQYVCLYENLAKYKDSHFNYIARLTKTIIEYANANQCADMCIESLSETILQHDQIRRHTKGIVQEAIDDALNR